MLADLIGELRGSPLNLSELKPLSEDAAMQEVRAAFANNAGACERAAIGFTEGGGGVMFCELARLEGSPLRRRIAAIFKEIYLDELSHSWPHLDAIERHARNEADWRRAEQIVATICRRRVRMRNEMFGNPLGIAEMRGIEAGKLEPWKAPSAA